MTKYRRYEKSGLMLNITLFIIGLVIGFIAGIPLAIFLFSVASAFLDAISMLLGTLFALALLLVILFSTSLIASIRIGIFGVITGIIISLILNHPILNSFYSYAPVGEFISFFVPVLVFIIIIILIIWILATRYTIVRRKDIVLGVERKDKKKRK